MNQEVAKKWVDALRSGEYKQGDCTLRIEDRFCCLGVLTDLYHQEWGGDWQRKDVGINPLGSSVSSLRREGESPNYAPQPVCDWVGLAFTRNREGSQYNYAALNDRGKTFAEIASQIEKDAGLAVSTTPDREKSE